MNPGMEIGINKFSKRGLTKNTPGQMRQQVRVIIIDFSLVYNLTSRDYYRLIALQMISQLAKFIETKHPLNIPVPECLEDYWDFISRLVQLDVCGLTICLKNVHHLSAFRRQEFNQFVLDVKAAKQFRQALKSIKITWGDKELQNLQENTTSF